jgi:hypothetical protein
MLAAAVAVLQSCVAMQAILPRWESFDYRQFLRNTFLDDVISEGTNSEQQH